MPEDSLKEYEGKFPEEPYTGDRGYLPHRTPRAAYAAMITRMDREVGRVTALIRNWASTTTPSSSSPATTARCTTRLGGTDTDFFNSAGGLRGRKGSLLRGRLPRAVHRPLEGPHRRRAPNAPASPASRIGSRRCWNLIGRRARSPAGLDGISFAPTLLGKTQQPRPFLYRESPGYGGQQSSASATGRRSARTFTPGPKAKDQKPGAVELYDLATDPAEKTDVAAKHPGSWPA